MIEELSNLQLATAIEFTRKLWLASKSMTSSESKLLRELVK